MGLRIAKVHEDAIPHISGDEPAEVAHGLGDAFLIGRNDLAQVLRVLADRERRRTDQVLALGNHEGAPIASLGIVAIAGPAWHSLRGGTIDSLIRLDLTLSPAAEGGAVVDVQGRVVGMAVLGPRRRALAIPTSTIDRVVDQLLAKGHVFRGYLGAGLQPVRLGRPSIGAHPPGSGRGILVASIDPDGPAARAGLLVGDIVTTWNAKPIDRVREVMRRPALRPASGFSRKLSL
jgi:S1-C subfamily serine protease